MPCCRSSTRGEGPAPFAEVVVWESLTCGRYVALPSGTTGLPKAAIIKHKRVYLTSVGFAKQFNISHSDKIYCTLPLYHSSGSVHHRQRDITGTERPRLRTQSLQAATSGWA
jgi:acyl-CoA synthetase (AMP-forming)/AMP-acid ligase II